MDQTTKISDPTVKLSHKDSSITGLLFNKNKNIFYLPVFVNEKLPNLFSYSAQACSLTEITKLNFNGLKKLKALWLPNNQIKKITSDTFEDLSSLELLYLRKFLLQDCAIKLNFFFVILEDNNIQFMNGQLFDNLNKLRVFNSLHNCVDENFESSTEIATISRLVSEKCGFEENSANETQPMKMNLFSFECGVAKSSNDDSLISSRIIGGTESVRGEWPFLVALHHLDADKFFCSGNLITLQHVLTGF